MKLIGKSPIPVSLLILSKVSMLLCWLFFIVKLSGLSIMIYDHPLMSIIAGFLDLIGFTFAIVGIINLGDSIAVGIREDETKLMTHGLYSVSRNPMYLGGFLISIGSCLYAFHIINIILLLTTVSLHHIIILREEFSLEKKFGPQWHEYSGHVARYFGRKG